MGRSWYGWNPGATDEELWEINRGVWRLSSGPIRERFATLSYQGNIQVVAEITGRERYHNEWALLGTVLLPGDPVRDALVGLPVRRQRNPISYFDTSGLDTLTTAERTRLQSRERATMIATWNPDNWSWPDRDEEVVRVEAGGILRGQWSTGSRKGDVEPGDRVFLLKQGDEPRGIIGSGTCASRIFQDEHWDPARAGEDANYVLIEWDTLLGDDDLLPHSQLVAGIPAGGEWRPQGSGTLLSLSNADELEALWARHLQQPAPVPPRTSPRQGWQLDSAKRKKVEDAAQARLMRHFDEDGWAVRDTRVGNPYDAVAEKPGHIRYLEAKGITSACASVIVTRGEVRWARQHLGECVIGILSDVRFLPGGDVDPDSGIFCVYDWNPDAGQLVPLDFDWTPTDGGLLPP
jgi:hypothetical protein